MRWCRLMRVGRPNRNSRLRHSSCWIYVFSSLIFSKCRITWSSHSFHKYRESTPALGIKPRPRLRRPLCLFGLSSFTERELKKLNQLERKWSKDKSVAKSPKERKILYKQASLAVRLEGGGSAGIYSIPVWKRRSPCVNTRQMVGSARGSLS